MISGLEYFHKKNILHRDIKPENLVIETDGKLTHFSCCTFLKNKPNLLCAPLCAIIGYLRITDFGIARMWREENAQDTSGTPGYMAPEVMCRQNHTTSVDFFAVGVIAYESMFGRVRDLVPKVAVHILTHSLFFVTATLHRQVTEGDPRPHSLEASSDKEARRSTRLVD